MSIQPVVFRCSCIKTLSAVEANPARSNQHEFNGVTQLKSIFGEPCSPFAEILKYFSLLSLGMMPEKRTPQDLSTGSIFRGIP
jgi:hypothetical protein